MTRYEMPLAGGRITDAWDTDGAEALTADELRAIIAGSIYILARHVDGCADTSDGSGCGAWHLFSPADYFADGGRELPDAD